MKAVIMLEIAALAVLAALTIAGYRNELEPGSAYSACIKGHMFAVFVGDKSDILVQIWENGPDGPRLMECKEVGNE